LGFQALALMLSPLYLQSVVRIVHTPKYRHARMFIHSPANVIRAIKTKNMKIIRNCMAAGTILIVCLGLSTNTHAQKFPAMIADSVNKWSEPATVRIQDEYKQVVQLDVFVKVKKFKGTTADCVVFFRNTGDKTISCWAGLQIGAKPADQSIYTVNAANFTLKPGEEVSYNLELRECLPKGRKGLDAVGKCAACAPNICFAEVRIK
jgi:hypothetical protein